MSPLEKVVFEKKHVPRRYFSKGQKVANGTFSSGLIHGITLNIIERLCCFDFFEPCANHRHARMALVTLEGHCVWLTPISRGRVSHSDSGLNTVGGVLACPWFVNDWHSLRIMPLSDVEKKKLRQSIKLNT